MPAQCPECGRFLKNDLVTGLADFPAPCPKCGSQLEPEMFGLVPATTTTDPLEGWEEGPATADRSSGHDVLALPADQALLAGIGGGILGALVWRGQPGAGALFGAIFGVVAGALARGAVSRG